jgi:hypothetical protein
MTSASSLTSLAATAGEIHGAVVASIIRGSKQKPRSTPPPMEKLLTQLRNAAKLSKEDFEKLNQIVDLAKSKPARLEETQLELRQIDEALQRKPASVHPLVLTISGIANDSATTALAAQKPSTNGNKGTRQLKKEEQVPVPNVLISDVAGALIGGYLAAKRGLSDYEIVITAVVAGSVASSEVGSGNPFPHFSIE